MTCKRFKPKSDNAPAADPLSQAEQEDVQILCSSIIKEEISFDSWCQKHSQLDLQIPIIVTREQLTVKFQTVITLTRTIRTSTAQGYRERREKIERELVLGPADINREAVLIKGLGDIQDEMVGNLLIIIQLKD